MLQYIIITVENILVGFQQMNTAEYYLELTIKN